MKTRDKAVIFLAILGLFTCLTDMAQAGYTRRVLVLNSYHPSLTWTKLVMKGIESAPGRGTKVTVMTPLKQEKIKSEARE